MASSPSPSTASTSSHTTTADARRAGGKPRVSAEHTLNRVRENQRRHRARRRDYIATLEQKLAETEEELSAARAEIAVLRAECDGRRNGNVNAGPAPATGGGATTFAYGNGGGGNAGEQSNKANAPQLKDISLFTYQVGGGGTNDKEMVVGPLELGNLGPHIEYPNVLTRSLLGISPGTTYLDTTSPSSSSPSPSPSTSTSSQALSAATPDPQNDIPLSVTGPAPCCEDTPFTPLPDPTDPECATCKTRPPPSPTESTTLCTQAYILISQQNFRNLDVATIRLWLYQGYRRAQRQGEGCRVENGVLFRLLDYISGVECDGSTHASLPCTQ